MRIDEVTANHKDQLDEIFGIGQYFKQRGAFKAGKRSIKATADNLMTELARWLGSQGITSYKQMDHGDMAEFLKYKKVGDDFIKNIDTNVPLNARTVRNIITYTARVAATGRGGKPLPGIKTSYTVDIAGVGDTTAQKDTSDAAGQPQDGTQQAKFGTKRTVPSGTKIKANNGRTYNWNGKTWTAVSSKGKVTNQRAPNAVVDELNQKAKNKLLQQTQK